jgi:hypothetical protein
LRSADMVGMRLSALRFPVSVTGSKDSLAWWW